MKSSKPDARFVLPMLHKRLLRQIFRYTLVGGLGFVVDAGGTYLMRSLTEAEPFWARAPAFLLAALITWALHSRFTFSATKLDPRKLPLYLGCAALGALLNLGIYVAVLDVAGNLLTSTLQAIVCGALAATVWNFLTSRMLLSQPQKAEIAP